MLTNNLRYLRKKIGLSQQEVANRLGVSRITYGDYERGKTEPNVAGLTKLAQIFNTDIDTLIRSQLSTTTKSMRETKLQILAITVDEQNEGNIEMVTSKARAGYTQQFTNPEFIRDLPRIHFPNIPQGSYRGFEIEGDSMLPLPEGSIVICTYVESLDHIKTGHTYVFVLKEDGLVYKRVAKVSDSKALFLESDNKTYAPLEIPHNEVWEIWKYFAHLSFTDPIESLRDAMDNRIESIQRKVDQIESYVRP